MATNENKRFLKILAASTLAVPLAFEIPPLISNAHDSYLLSKIQPGMEREDALRILGRGQDSDETIYFMKERSFLRHIFFRDCTYGGHSITFKQNKVESIDGYSMMFME